MSLLGIHHVSAICSDAQRTVDFYVGLLGLRLVKVTVNFDDPSTYHLYFADHAGTPGSVMTFFVWPGGHRGRVGPPQVSAVAFSIARSSLSFWLGRIAERGVPIEDEGSRFGERFVRIADPDGMAVELIAGDDDRPAWPSAAVPGEHAIRGLHSVTLSERGLTNVRPTLVDVMELKELAAADDRTRFAIGRGGAGALLDVRDVDSPVGRSGVGIVHHVAFRVADDAREVEWRERLLAAGLNATPVMERNYFRSIYYREPGGVLFELATDGPGFAVDEPLESLGQRLMLPAWYEARREEITAKLPRFAVPGTSVRLP